MDVRSGYLYLGDERTYYEIRGAGPPLIMIHGGLMDRRMWKWQAGFMAEHYTVILYDVRGHGRSDMPLSPYSQHEDLRAIMDQMRVPRGVILGMAMGGAIALDFALAYPGRVSALVLQSPALSGASYSDDLVQHSQALAETVRDAGAEMALWMIQEDPFWRYMIPAPQHAPARKLFLEIARGNVRTLLIDPGRIRKPERPAAERLGEITVPTLVLTAQRDHPDNRKVAQMIAEASDAAQVSEVAEAGHLANMEQPVRYNMVVRRFLAGLERKAS